MLAELNPQLDWYIARTSGLVAWSVVTASILWGLALSTRLVRRRGVPAWLLDLHRFLGTLSLLFVGVHLLALWGDNYVYFAWKELFVPGGSPWRTAACAWGIVAMYFMIAIQLTSWSMRRIPRKLWHTIHLSSFLLFIGSTVHAFQAGADAGNLLVQWGALTGSTLVLFLIIFRVLAPRKSQLAAERLGRASAATSA